MYVTVSLSFVSSVIFQRQRGPRCRRVTLNQQHGSRKREGERGREKTGRKNIAVVTTPQAPVNIFPTKIESGSIRALRHRGVSNHERDERERERIGKPAWRKRERVDRSERKSERDRDGEKAALPTNGT